MLEIKKPVRAAKPTGFLHDHPNFLDLIRTPAYHARKQERFPAADKQHIASNEAFLLSQPEVRALYIAKYKETSGLYYAGQVPFVDLLARITQHISRL